MKKATYDDLYDCLSFQVWKSGREMIKELEDQNYTVGHMRGTMYVHLSRWEDEGLIRSQPRTDVAFPSGQEIKTREYIRISQGKPKKLFDASEEGGLEGHLTPSPA